jgi:hypothetical protein
MPCGSLDGGRGSGGWAFAGELGSVIRDLFFCNACERRAPHFFFNARFYKAIEIFITIIDYIIFSRIRPRQ